MDVSCSGLAAMAPQAERYLQPSLALHRGTHSTLWRGRFCSASGRRIAARSRRRGAPWLWHPTPLLGRHRPRLRNNPMVRRNRRRWEHGRPMVPMSVRTHLALWRGVGFRDGDIGHDVTPEAETITEPVTPASPAGGRRAPALSGPIRTQASQAAPSSNGVRGVAAGEPEQKVCGSALSSARVAPHAFTEPQCRIVDRPGLP